MWPMSPILYSTTRGTSGDIDKVTDGARLEIKIWKIDYKGNPNKQKKRFWSHHSLTL
jgi:hypothetical protein